jgi:hypothetical protein
VTTCADIITYAMRQTKVLGSGKVPTAPELVDGMIALQSFYDLMVTDGLFGSLTDLYKTDDYEAKEFERITAPTGVTITFPALLDDLTNGGSRPPRDLAIIETIVNGTRTVQLWDRTAWVPLTGLASSDDAPLAERGAWALGAAFAISGTFIAMFGESADVTPTVAMLGSRFMGSLSAKRTTQEVGPGVYY